MVLCLILCILAWVPGVIYAYIIILQTKPLSPLTSVPSPHLVSDDAAVGAARDPEPASQAIAPAQASGAAIEVVTP